MSITVKLIGGVGNQLFQYAFARSISSKLKTGIILDPYAFETSFKMKGYSYILDHFNIVNTRLAKSSDNFGLVWLYKHPWLFDQVINRFRFKNLINHRYYQEKGMPFNSEVFFKKDGTFFNGFWQTEKYFKDLTAEIRKEITLKEPFSSHSAKIEQEISHSVAVSLHIRRYIPEGQKSGFRNCPVEYYERAIEYILAWEPAARFFLFSDDYDCVKNNFNMSKYPVTLVDNDNDKNCEDIILMSHCRHHIISNSTFSWWGAWLNPDPKKIVIAPKDWPTPPKNDIRDLVPEEWIKI